MTKAESIKRSQCSRSKRKMNAANLRLDICTYFRGGMPISRIAVVLNVTDKYIYQVLKKERLWRVCQ